MTAAFLRSWDGSADIKAESSADYALSAMDWIGKLDLSLLKLNVITLMHNLPKALPPLLFTLDSEKCSAMLLIQCLSQTDTTIPS